MILCVCVCVAFMTACALSPLSSLLGCQGNSSPPLRPYVLEEQTAEKTSVYLYERRLLLHCVGVAISAESC